MAYILECVSHILTISVHLTRAYIYIYYIYIYKVYTHVVCVLHTCCIHVTYTTYTCRRRYHVVSKRLCLRE